MEIELTKGKVAIIDDDDHDVVSMFSWHFGGCYGDLGYARSASVSMHRLIMRHELKKHSHDCVVDHINRNPLDNRKCNLRVVTQQVNSLNRRKQVNNTSGHTGVCWDKRHKKWKASYRSRALGYWRDMRHAVAARQAAEASGAF